MDIPIQYKKLADECINDIMNTAKRLYPIITELGNSITIDDDKMVVVISKKGRYDSKWERILNQQKHNLQM